VVYKFNTIREMRSVFSLVFCFVFLVFTEEKSIFNPLTSYYYSRHRYDRVVDIGP